MPIGHVFFIYFSNMTDNIKLKKKKEIQCYNAFIMCCEPIRTASGQTQRVVMEVATWCPGSSSFDTKTPAPGWTRTLAQEEQCILGTHLDGNSKETEREGGGRIPFLRNLSLFQTAQDAGSSMSYMWIQAGRQDLSSSPICFSALQDSWTRVEAPGGDLTSSSASGPRDFNTFVFAAISV